MPAMTLTPKLTSPLRRHNHRTLRVTGAVLLGHVGLIWLASTGLLNTVAPGGETEQTIMASVVMEMPAPPNPVTQPLVAKTPPQARTPTPPQATPALTPTPVAVPVTTPAAPSTAAPIVPGAAPAATATTTGTQRPNATAPTATAAVVLPSSDADYLNNPTPTYPSMSRRMGEQGTVLLRVFINTDGRAEKAEIRTSSGYSRLDEAALATVQRWRYVPGKRAGVAEAMWFNVPIRFLLD
jgi:periplasmic protein TonB